MRYNEKTKLFTDFEASYNSCDDCNINLIDIKQGLYLLFTFVSYENSNPIKPNFYVTKIISNKSKIAFLKHLPLLLSLACIIFFFPFFTLSHAISTFV